MNYPFLLALLIPAASARAVSLENAATEASIAAENAANDPCRRNLALNLRDLTMLNRRPGPPDPYPRAPGKLRFVRCENAGTPAAPRARRYYEPVSGGEWNLVLINALGSDEVSVVEIRRDVPGAPRERTFGTVKLADLLHGLVVLPWEQEMGPATPLAMELVLGTIDVYGVPGPVGDPCLQNIELSVRDLSVTVTPLSPANASLAAKTRYDQQRECLVVEGPSAMRVFLRNPGDAGAVLLITKRGSDETTFAVGVRLESGGWFVLKEVKSFKTRDLLSPEGIRLRGELPGANGPTGVEIRLDTIPYEHD